MHPGSYELTSHFDYERSDGSELGKIETTKKLDHSTAGRKSIEYIEVVENIPKITEFPP